MSIPRTTAALLLMLAPVAAQADPVTDTCAERDTAEVCICATQGLAAALSPEDYAVYAAASETALAERAGGAALVDAWETATALQAEANGIGKSAARQILNGAGAAHRDAIKACGG